MKRSAELNSNAAQKRFPPLFQAVAEVELRELLNSLWRRRRVVFGAVFVLTALATLVVFQLTPRYTGEAYVMIDPGKSQVVDVKAVISGLSGDIATIQSEILVMRSRGLAEKVVDRLGLMNNPEFNQSLRPDHPLAKLVDPRSYLTEEWIEVVTGGSSADEMTDEQRQARDLVRVVDVFLDRLEVDPAGRSRVIKIAFESEKAGMAARVANTLAELYIVAQLDAKFDATRQATIWLTDRLSSLRGQLENSEKAVENFRKNSGLVEGRGETLASQQIAELNSQLVLGTTARAEAEARLEQLESLLASGGGMETAVEVLRSPLIQRLREQEAEVERKTAAVSAIYGERHPKMISVRAERTEIRQKIDRELVKIAQGLRNEVAFTRAREHALVANMDRLKVEVADLNAADIDLRALEREAAANRALFETFLVRSKETSSQENFERPDARIISRAAIPESASFPKKGVLIPMAFVASVLAGFLLAVLIEQLDHGFRSLMQIERITGVAPLGSVPALKRISKIADSPESYVLAKPASAYGEAIRTLHTSLVLSNVDTPPKVIAFASSLPGEGKTSMTLSFARLLANIGQKVVVVDCDLRKPRAHDVFGAPLEPGLVEYLAGTATFEEVVHQDKDSPASIISAGAQVPNPSELLGSNQMERLLSKLAGSYDLVVLDTSPVLAVSDVRILSRLVHKVVFLVRWADTRREVAMSGLRQLVDAGADVAGVVLSMVDVKQQSGYGYSGSGYYYGRPTKYYTG